MLIFFISKKVQILKTGCKYGQYCTPVSQSDCRYFFVSELNVNTIVNWIILFEIKAGSYPKFLIPETIKSLQTSKKVITKEGCGENMQWNSISSL